MHKEEGVIKAPSFLRFWGRSITAVGQKWGKKMVNCLQNLITKKTLKPLILLGFGGPLVYLWTLNKCRQ